MAEQLTGRRRLGHSFALIYHRKRLIGKDFVDTQETVQASTDCRWEVQNPIQSDSHISNG